MALMPHVLFVLYGSGFHIEYVGFLHVTRCFCAIQHFETLLVAAAERITLEGNIYAPGLDKYCI